MDRLKNTKEWTLFTQGAKIGWCAAHLSDLIFFLNTENTFCNSYSKFVLASTQINVQRWLLYLTFKFQLLFTTCIFLFLYLVIFIYFNIYWLIYCCCVFLGYLLATLKTRMICLVNGGNGKATPTLVGCLSQRSYSLLLFISTSTKWWQLVWECVQELLA